MFVTHETIKEALELLVETKKSGRMISCHNVNITGIPCTISGGMPQDPLLFKSSKYEDITFAVEARWEEFYLYIFEGKFFRVRDEVVTLTIPYSCVAILPEQLEKYIAEYGSINC